jgi:hypothetical protein
VEVRVDGVRQGVPPKTESITYEIIVDSDEADRRLELVPRVRDAPDCYGHIFRLICNQIP